MKKFALISVALLAFVPAAMADIVVSYDMDELGLGFAQATNNLVITETAGSLLTLNKFDNGASVDLARIFGGGNFDLVMDLTLNQVSAENWTAAGSFMFTDLNGDKVQAHVQSTSIYIDGNTNLHIDGALTDLGTNTTILVGGDPWVFTGNSGAAGQDGLVNQITVQNPESFDGGLLFTLKFATGTSSLDAYFGADQAATGGTVAGTVVPAPGAVILGAMGLSLIGWIRRRFA